MSVTDPPVLVHPTSKFIFKISQIQTIIQSNRDLTEESILQRMNQIVCVFLSK